ncbi:hypothetical protein [Methylobacterium sp. J-070]|uniref:hypothetical protein n=1 Tax=Methylobacterium sp. J-070 TaxID=2836650 RepID=UPI001FB93EE7|nr:hypothetical protein [Methylobacterium sp. J-070]MCJ2050053.1 hypothetical protein [Methylobacterium sp. J-070]
MLNRVVLAAVVLGVAAFLLYLAALARAAFSPNEPYAASIGLTLDQCVAVQNGLSPEDARAYCRQPVPKRL